MPARQRRLSQFIKMGWIEKQSKHLGIFKKRWIEVYANDKLCSYSNKSDISPTEIIDLRNLHKVYKCIINPKEFLLVYSTEDNKIESRRFRVTESSKEASEWIQFFMEQVEQNQISITNRHRVHRQSEDKNGGRRGNSYTHTDNNSLPLQEVHVQQKVRDKVTNGNYRITNEKSTKSSYVTHVGSINRTSLDNFIEEIANDLRQNHHYLAVILEDKE